ncbi:protein with a methyltransferase domain [Psychroflexus torquis ATCC 700755]|uniref:Protein with a methyltransferase domain n=1 Tax=Psychroflexus torquis (strain ATCC 700755 / CIP 106069 / ACAM 623) TaxID=313595 RepID=K4IB78_PSYTT|nr:class I SAM-dependent methyltransferase [Psychroflexus torquis]AFU67862.1 protein with a methyltransferase domain [Psychroflexus torquis ATCC 700755]
MENFNRKKHWETIYQTKQFEDVSWFQPTPETSLSFFKQLNIPTSAKIIDIGGGDSFLVDNLLNLNYQDLTVLDISATALDKVKQRLGERADKVKWIVADVATFRPTEKYDFWHDRAAFHFLTQELEIENYLNTVQKSIQPTGIFVIGTFSKQGPKKCSGIEIKQYSETTMTDRLAKFFEKIKCIKVDHKTPSDSIQNFIFCSFKKLRKKSVTHF